ncbi:hypothetical protein NMY22_g18413 [Coprinellus aureogranulatus]|nr:hypothetical protein NMY22_g18413 [Coprinellus aureogranulatus]
MLHNRPGRVVGRSFSGRTIQANKENMDSSATGSNTNTQSTPGRKRASRQSASRQFAYEVLLTIPPSSRMDALVGHGRHFGRTIHAFCRIFPLIKEGLSRLVQLQAGMLAEDDLTDRELREQEIFQDLTDLCPGLEARILKASPEELHYVADMIAKGSSGARADDTKSLKSVIIDWITPRGGALNPPLSRNVKTDRGFYHDATGELLCPATLDWKDPSIKTQLKSGEISVSGDVWPVFLYRDHKFNPDNPWDGLLQGKLLVSAYKHVFTSPSSVDQETRATRSGNAELHGMTSVSIPSIAYIATLVRFALGSSAVFCRNDRTTDSERFYKSIVDWLESPEEHEEVQSLINWWNRKIFPAHHTDGQNGKAVIPTNAFKNCFSLSIIATKLFPSSIHAKLEALESLPTGSYAQMISLERAVSSVRHAEKKQGTDRSYLIHRMYPATVAGLRDPLRRWTVTHIPRPSETRRGNANAPNDAFDRHTALLRNDTGLVVVVSRTQTVTVVFIATALATAACTGADVSRMCLQFQPFCDVSAPNIGWIVECLRRRRNCRSRQPRWRMSFNTPKPTTSPIAYTSRQMLEIPNGDVPSDVLLSQVAPRSFGTVDVLASSRRGQVSTLSGALVPMRPDTESVESKS